MKFMTEDVIITTKGRTGCISLNRPRALHALTQHMCRTISEVLLGWADDPAIELVIIDHHQGRGFCAGGDVRRAAESGAADGADARAFFLTEYRLNHLMFGYAKPIIAFMDGVTMGGGAGVALPCRARVATENTLFAMPEATIGLFPDVGACWYLSRLPGRTGAFLALTGARLDGAECLHLSLASHYLAAASLAEVKNALAADPQDWRTILDTAGVMPPEARIARNHALIDRLFTSDAVEEILEALRQDDSRWAARELQTLNSKCPMTMKVALRLLRESATRTDFAEQMRQEYAIAARMSSRHDFVEGVRALLVDKDGVPRWEPADPAEIDAAMVDAIFAPMGEGEQWQPL